MDVWQRVIDLEARMITLQKRVADTYQKTPVMISTDPFHTDYKTYDGPFMMGFPSGASVRVGPGYVLAPGGGYAWTGGTGSLAYAGANFVTLDVTMDGDTVDSAAIGCYGLLSNVKSTPGLRKVLIGVAQRSGGKVVGRTQEQRGNIYIGARAQPVLDFVVTGAILGAGSSYTELPIGYDPLYGTILKRYRHDATYEIAETAGAVRNTIKFLQPDEMYRLTITGCFIKTSGTTDTDTDYPELRVCKGASSAGNASTDVIHAMGYRKGVFVETPEMYGFSSYPGSVIAYASTPSAAADGGPNSIPAAYAVEWYAPTYSAGVGSFRENFALNTLLVPSDDLTDDTLSLWGKGLRTVEYEIAIKRMDAQYD